MSSDLTLASNEALNLKVTAQRLAGARSEIKPRIAATIYTLDDGAIQDQPDGSDIHLIRSCCRRRAFPRILSGKFISANDHANTQYRINGLIPPKGGPTRGMRLAYGSTALQIANPYPGFIN